MSDRRTLVAVAKSVARTQALSKEKKYVDTQSTYNYDTTGSRIDVSIVATGTGVNGRIGKMIGCDSVQIRGSITASASANECTCTYLIYDREPNAAAALPAVADILTSASSVSLTNRDNAPRFKIVRKWNNLIIAPDSKTAYIDEFVKLGNKYPIKWLAANTDGATASKVKGNLILMTLGNNANSAATPVGALNVRLNYSDS